ncbi:MAG: N-formylglutamate amidohydrolase [Betaproteobacteria bacterium]
MVSRTIDAFLITCEHGDNRIPPAYRALFDGLQPLLDTHRGYDPGALRMAIDLAAAFGAPLVSSTVSRLLVDLNRSLGHRQLFSAATREIPRALREDILARHYRPYRTEVERLAAQFVARRRRVLHISSHSFTPVLDGNVRTTDIGLLYDPARHGERALAARWKIALEARSPALRVRRNYPYQGKGDGLTSHLRSRFPATAYVGVELEINQQIVFDGGRPWSRLRQQLIESLREAAGD